MYGIVLAAALTSGTTAADWGFKHHCGCGCYCGGCYCGGWCGCGCYGCYGGYCGGYGCWCGGCRGCWTSCGCYGCYGYCGGWGCCSCSCGCYCGGYGYVSGACYGCYGACTAIPYYAAPAVGVPAGGVIIGGEVKAATDQAATVIVKANKDIQLKVNGQAAPRKSDEETYTSPALTPGKTYSYTFVAERTVDGKLVSETKEVNVYAGRSSLVDFSDFGKAPVALAEAAAPANVTVVLPENAKLTVNDVVVNAKGKQTFATPRLEKGKSYFYTVKMEVVRDGKPVTETRKIDVAAGKDVTVDFTATANLTASR